MPPHVLSDFVVRASRWPPTPT